MEKTHTINVEFDLVLNMALITGHTVRAETHISFNYDLKLIAEADDEALEIAVAEFMQTEEMAVQKEQVGRELVELLVSRMNTMPFSVQDVKNIVVTEVKVE